MTTGFTEATRDLIYARVAAEGPTNAGKTATMLIFACTFAELRGGGKVGVIDTERSRARHYANVELGGTTLHFLHKTLEPPFLPERYIDAIHEAAAAGITQLVIDSITHEWQGCLDEVDRIKRTGAKNQWMDPWGNITPRHDKFIQAILQYPGDIFLTTRSKMEYEQIEDEHGKKKIQRVGMKAQQREGLEYEWDFIFTLDADHHARVTKTMRSILLDADIRMPTATTAADLFRALHSDEASDDYRVAPAHQTPINLAAAQPPASEEGTDPSPGPAAQTTPTPSAPSSEAPPSSKPAAAKPPQSPAGPRQVLVENATRVSAWPWFENCIKRDPFNYPNLETALAALYQRMTPNADKPATMTKDEFQTHFPKMTMGDVIDQLPPHTSAAAPQTPAPSTPPTNELEAFKAGQAAAEAGKPASSCPFHATAQTILFKAWQNGHETAPARQTAPA